MVSELTGDDRDLVERLAVRIVELHMEVPAVLAIETGKPLSLLASQAMLFLEPVIQSLFSVTGYRRLALLLERRDALEALADAIEQRAEAIRASRRPAAPRDTSGGSPGPGR